MSESNTSMQYQTVMKMARWYFDPIFLNAHQLSTKKPALFVGNHTLYGLLDVPLMVQELQDKHDIHLRSLGDRVHFNIPVWRDMLVNGGMVLGTPENCHQLMQVGESILVFPGGAREVMKRKGEKYKLIWKKRSGFARLAIEHGYDIIPFAAMGADDCFDIVLDANDIQQSKISQLALRLLGLNDKIRGGDILPPISTGLLKLPLPKPQKFYFNFGERISTENMALDEKSVWNVREKVAMSIENQLDELESYRESDQKQNWSWLRKRLAKTTVTL